jgi:hypothetical protein
MEVLGEKAVSWRLEGYDTFAHESYPLMGSYPDEASAREAAREFLKGLERNQATNMSGGPPPDGIQDMVMVVRPDGSKYRYWDEVFRNERVAVRDISVRPSESEPPHIPSHAARVDVCLAGGAMSAGRVILLRRGDVRFASRDSRLGRNVGPAELRFIRIGFLGTGQPSSQAWGMAGLSPNCELRFENEYARVYAVRVPAGAEEPQHTHRDRVVVCLSGAGMQDILLDGSRDITGPQVNGMAWCAAATHSSRNLGNTDLWEIVVEPK